MRSRTPVSGPGPEQGRVCDLCGPGGPGFLWQLACLSACGSEQVMADTVTSCDSHHIPSFGFRVECVCLIQVRIASGGIFSCGLRWIQTDYVCGPWALGEADHVC